MTVVMFSRALLLHIRHFVLDACVPLNGSVSASALQFACELSPSRLQAVEEEESVVLQVKVRRVEWHKSTMYRAISGMLP
jgi:hypothetical protein